MVVRILKLWHARLFCTFGDVVERINVAVRLIIGKYQRIKPAAGDKAGKQHLTVLLEKAGRPGPPESWLSPEYYAYQQREDEDDGDQFRVIDRDGGEACFVTDNAKWGTKVKKLFIVDYA